MSVKILTLIDTVLLLFAFWGIALCQPKSITVIFGNGEKMVLSDWSFVYHLTRRNEILVKGSSFEVLKEKSHNLYLMERYDEEEGKMDFDKKKEVNIDYEKLSSIEYLWNWEYGSAEKVIITFIDGTKLERVRLGPISTSFFGEEKFIYGEGIYLEGSYKFKDEWKQLKYNLNKWLSGEIPRKEIIVKIIFQ